jgi:hypothetical protein
MEWEKHTKDSIKNCGHGPALSQIYLICTACFVKEINRKSFILLKIGPNL